ncbi:MAG: hypothetical protein RSC41_05155 [Oscillospiraceae bacterium]
MSSSIENNGKKMFYWSDQRISWYDDAAKISQYHNVIIKNIFPYVDKNSTVFDVACGLGYISEKISPFVKDVCCFDIDKNAITSLGKRCHHIENIQCIYGDWKENLIGRKCDVAIMSYCNGIIEHFDFLSSVAQEYIIGIHLFKNKVHNFGVNNHTDLDKTFTRRETTETIMEFLNKKNIPYEVKKISCEFGQPFRTKAEVYDFIREYFKLTNISTIEAIISENLVEKDNYFYLPNNKESGIIIINTKNNNVRETK